MHSGALSDPCAMVLTMTAILGNQARLMGYAETGTPEWHKMREGAMTGSRIAAAMGLSPWTSPFALYFQMLGMASEETPVEDAPWLAWGSLLEPVVIDHWARQHPSVRVRRRKTVWQNRQRPWQVCSPDGLIVTQGTGPARRPAGAVLEIKTSRYRDDWGEPGTDEIPVYYRCQALWMLDTLGLEWCHFGVLFGGSDYQEYLVRWHEDDIALLRERGWEFVERVRRQERPDIDAHSATYEIIRKFHPEIRNETVELPDDLAQQVALASAQMREAEDTLLTVRSSLAEFMGQAKAAMFNGDKYADRRSRSGGRPYVQLAPITNHPRTIREAVS